LPAVAHLEMALAAMFAANSQLIEDRLTVYLKRVIWLQPLFVDESRELHIRLRQNSSEEVEYEMYTDKVNDLQQSCANERRRV